ncbi:MAG: glutathione peroxidase [Flammeovirgaceae bacterium]|jgi:glutathione peroxidase|nr:glutathione peroxidase [Flammeovirgaceae bacterium]
MKATILLFLMITNANLYDFRIDSLEGKEIDFSQYKGKTLLIVNTASRCGYTPQYEELQKMHELYGNKITILGFPANNFGGQEPGSNLQIAEFCKANYGVTFQMFEKISVKGADQHPLYAWLKEKTGEEPSWNFCKYLIKPDGSVQFFKSSVKPMDKQILDNI